MYWIRRNSRIGSWAALFALTIQLFLSFGHIHLGGIQGSSAVLSAQSQVTSHSPADDDSGPAGHCFCAICASLNLTATSILPVVALLAAPFDHSHKWFAFLSPAQVSYRIHFLFQPRAPPHSI